VGHLLAASTAATASLLLRPALACSPLLSASSTALTVAGPKMHCRHRGVLSFLLLDRDGDDYCHYDLGLLAVMGGKKITLVPSTCLFAISTSESRMQSSLGSLFRNKQLKKALFSWPLGQSAASQRVTPMASGWPAGAAGGAVLLAGCQLLTYLLLGAMSPVLHVEGLQTPLGICVVNRCRTV
jgi:hypothetical protein